MDLISVCFRYQHCVRLSVALPYFFPRENDVFQLYAEAAFGSIWQMFTIRQQIPGKRYALLLLFEIVLLLLDSRTYLESYSVSTIK